MNAHRWSRRDRRALLAGGIVIAVALFGFRGIPALIRWTTGERRRAQRLSSAVADARMAISTFQWMRDSAAVRRKRRDGLDSLFVPGANAMLAAAALAGELSDDAMATGVTVAAIQADSVPDPDTTILRVRARASVSGDLASIMQFLVLVEAGPPLLTVRELVLAQRDGQVVADRAEMMHADMVVEGIAKAPSADSGTRVRAELRAHGKEL